MYECQTCGGPRVYPDKSSSGLACPKCEPRLFTLSFLRSEGLAPAMHEDKLVQGYRLILEGLGIDLSGEHFKDTPQRAAKAMFHELCAGLTGEPPKVTTFQSASNEMVILTKIPILSICGHHLLPFVGSASIGYLPTGKLLGLSKLSRLANYHARRPQVQEELTCQIADDIAERLGVDAHTPGGTTEPYGSTGGVGVLIRANHFCMEMRGVRHSGDMRTCALRGVFEKPEVRAEFFRLAGDMA